jgi:predicted nucleic acid-binding protein
LTRYMLDTNIISDLIRSPQGRAAKRIARVGENNICTSIIVAAELRYGCARSFSKRLRKAVEDLLSEIDVLPLDVPADTEYGGIRSELEAAGKPNRRKRPADRRARPCDRRHDRDSQYPRVQTHPRPERGELARLNPVAVAGQRCRRAMAIRGHATDPDARTTCRPIPS